MERSIATATTSIAPSDVSSPPPPPRAPRTRFATTRHRMTMAIPINAFERLLLADSSARTLPPAVMYWYPASMTKNAAVIAATAAPTLISVSNVRTIGAVSILQTLPSGAVHTDDLRASAQTHATCKMAVSETSPKRSWRTESPWWHKETFQ